MIENGNVLVDYHAHILAGIDDGARTVEMSEKLVMAAQKARISLIYATPHFYAHRDSVDSFCKRRESAKNIIANISDVEIKNGAEILLVPGIEKMPRLEKLAYEGSNRLLIEMPLSSSLIQVEHYDSIEQLCRNFEVVLAHANRYSDETVYRLLDCGVILQLNAEDALRLKERRRIELWRDFNAKFLLGSDVHHKIASYRTLKKAYDRWI